jgi:hypothetical protein
MTSYQPALQRCLKLRKLAEHQISTLSVPITVPPPPLALSLMEELPPMSYSIDTSRTKADSEDKYTKDIAKRAAAKHRSLMDAQELIGRILSKNPSIYQPFTPSKNEPKNTQIQINPTPEPPPLVASPPPAPMAELPSLIAATLDQHPVPMRHQFELAAAIPPLVATPAAPIAELPSLIAAILAHPVPTPNPTAFQFHQTPAAAAHNARILRRHNNDLAQAIIADGNSPLQYGSEFRPKSILAPLLCHHPNWPYINELLTTGCSFIAPPLLEPDRLTQIELALSFGNHKGALNKPQQLIDLLHDDIIHGYNLPVSIDMVHKIPGLVLSPMNIAKQNTIDETGRVIEKDRLTHDHSFDFFPGSSVNSRCRLDLHQTCMFGKSLSRMFHWIVHMRMKYPHNRILLTKTDWKSAYRRAHLHVDTALQCATHRSDTLLIPLRMTFGGAPCPASWSCISNTGCDLATDLANDPAWEPLQLKSPQEQGTTTPSERTTIRFSNRRRRSHHKV